MPFSITGTLLTCAAIFAIVCTTCGKVVHAQGPQPWAKERLEKSPRHGEWVMLNHDNRPVNCFITYPEAKDKATAVIVIHEIFGLTDWVRGVTDQLAEAGYIAIAPDLLWGKAANGEGTDAIVKAEGGEAVRRHIFELPSDQITADLNAVYDYASKLPSCNGKVVVCGYCWGGGESFRYTTTNKNLKACFSFYGPPPTKQDDVARINCPVYGFYAGNDNRIDAMLPAITDLMKKESKTYEPVTYEGAGHGFMRDGEDPTSTAPNHVANVKARDEAWTRWKELLKSM
ncbi:MAG TPA: dienelactone hydrolase family protein [Pirellulales bacterium]|nr:dienelactone hydrolase family protein [Pirellulales bacterium]